MEVLVALLISGICLAVVFQAFSQSTRLRAKAENVMDAAHLLHELMNDPGFMGHVLQSRGGFGPVPGAEGWVYEATLDPIRYVPAGTTQEQEVPDMVSVTLCVKSRFGAGRCLTGWHPFFVKS